MKTLIKSLSILCLVICAPVAASDSVPVQIVERMQKSVVPILCVQMNEKNEVKARVTLGSAFFINRNGDVLTAGHVIAALQELTAKPNPCVGVIYATKAEWKDRYRGIDIGLRWFPLASCKYKPDVDIGFCSPIKNPFLDSSVGKSIQPAILATYTRYNDGSAIAFTGFPLQYIYPITSKGYTASYDPITKKLILDKTAWPGASGSPLYVTDGKVIGLIVEQGTDKSAGLSFARPTDLILDFLRENKIPIEK